MSIGKIILGVGIVVVLGFGVYALLPLFQNTRLDEALPGSAMVKDEGAMTDTGADATAEMMTEKEGESMMAKGEVAVMEPRLAVIVPTAAHPASGTVRIVEADGKSYVRYENFKTINGPDLYVYLAKDLQAKEYVDLGRLKATEGNINYEIPAGVSVNEYPYVLVWCRAFGVLFNSAKIN